MLEPPEFCSEFPSNPGEPRSTQNDQLSLREFAQRVSLICNLETGGKLGPQEAYKKVKGLYKQLKKSRPNAT
jgi:glutathione peroxidase-family protein